MTHPSWRRRGLVTVLVAIIPLAGAAPSQRWRPIALTALGPDRVAVLSSTGDIDLITGGARRRIGTISGRQVADIAGLAVNGTDVLIVSSWLRLGSGDVSSVLEVFNSGFRHQQLGRMYSGLAVSSKPTPMGFAADAKSRELFRFALSGRSFKPSLLGVVPSPEGIIGAVAVDPEGATLFAVDAAHGEIWRVPTSGGTATLFATGLRDPRGIAADTETVYVADADGRKILAFSSALSTGKYSSRPSVKSSPKMNVRAPQRASAAAAIAPSQFQEPSAVTLGPKGQLWVADASARAVFVVSVPDYQIRRTIQ